MPSRLQLFFEDGQRAEGRTLAAFPSEGVRVNFFLHLGAPIEFDFDLREMVDGASVSSLVRLLRLVSTATGKDVVVRPEGQRDEPPVLRIAAATGDVSLHPTS